MVILSYENRTCPGKTGQLVTLLNVPVGREHVFVFILTLVNPVYRHFIGLLFNIHCNILAVDTGYNLFTLLL